MGLQDTTVQTIMIIEDEDDILQIYKDFLESKGYVVEASAPTANEVLADYKTYRPDLVMIDYSLPGAMNGLQAAQKILETDSQAKIMIVTAYDSINDELESNKFFSGKKILVVQKPVKLATLQKIISAL